MNAKKLYAFGDSFTNYSWPMWPAIMAQSFDRTHNYGLSGGGNFQIFFNCINVLLSQEISENDTFIIQWTEPLRHDHLDNGDWATLGIESSEQFIRAGIDHLNNIETAELKQLFYMFTLAKILKEKKCRWFYLFLNNESIIHKNVKEYHNNYGYPYKKRFEMIEYLNSCKENFIDSIALTEFFVKKKMKIGQSSTIVNNRREVFHDPHPTTKYTFMFIEEILSFYIQDLDLEKMKEFSKNIEEILIKTKIRDFIKIESDVELFYQTNKFNKEIKYHDE
jgi:hypothetical protein